MEQKESAGAPALERGLDLIEWILCGEGPVSFSTLEQQCGIPKASLNRLLKVLCARNYLRKEESGLYAAGARCHLLGGGGPILKALERFGAGTVKALSQAAHNTAILFYWDGKYTRVAAKDMQENSLGMQPVGNVSRDYLSTPWGWILLADPGLDPEIREEHREFAASAAYREKLDFYREHGYALDHSGNFLRYAAPVICRGRTVGMLGLGGNILTIAPEEIDRVGRAVAAAAAALSGQLG